MSTDAWYHPHPPLPLPQADMMLPGVIVPDAGLGPISDGQKRCIKVDGNEQPFAVGKMLVSEADITRTVRAVRSAPRDLRSLLSGHPLSRAPAPSEATPPGGTLTNGHTRRIPHPPLQ